jgi:hypothetical protein
MDGNTIAQLAVTLVGFLTAYFQKAAESGANELGKEAASTVWQKARQLFDLVRGKLSHRQDAQTTLDKFANSPSDPAMAEAVRSELELLLSQDTSLITLFREQLIELDESGADRVFQTNIHGQVKNFTQIGKMYGDLKIS